MNGYNISDKYDTAGINEIQIKISEVTLYQKHK